jgi:iron(II)-dependent oxidoreductase
MPLRLLSRNRQNRDAVKAPRARLQPPPPPRTAPYEAAEPVALPTDELKRHMQLERFGMIVANAPRWRTQPEFRNAIAEANRAIDEQFALVPEGYASIPRTINDNPGNPELDHDTQPFLLARCCVTNAQYQNFVDDGGYENLELWPKDIWPHLIDFIDLTEQPGPRFWRNGRHDKRLARHPVVGICWYEAAAYAHWAGYRLPTEAEWQMAASWRIRSAANVLRRYPWGDALDKRRCNIWSSGIATTTPVHEYEAGAAPNGILQLIGNIWEWTASDFEVTDEDGRPVVGDMLMKSIRGGAFDTYFQAQATSVFRTGLACLMRAHNVGFRCALDEKA